MAAVPVTAEIARRATALAWRDLPDDLVERTKQCLLDWFAVTVAGAQEELTDILVREALEDGAKGPATLVGRSEKVLPSAATLINGAASHALDYDDVNFSMGGHPTVTVVPALLALGEQMGATGRLFIESFVAGYETSGRVGRLVSPSHYQKGFHVTGTVGSFSATAAAGRMLGLSDKQLAVAFGIAATQAAGLKSNFGTMCKPLHAGTASEHGLRAARLAAKGFTARADSLECDQGFASSQSDHLNAEAALGEPPAGWHLRNNLFKYHAACYLTHAPIECAKEIRLKSNFPPERVKKILLRIDAGADKVCNIENPTTGLEAKFSLRQTVAMALTGVDTANLDSYNDAVTQEPRIKSSARQDVDRVQAQLGAFAGRDGDPARRRHDPRGDARFGHPVGRCRQAAPGARDQVREPGDAGAGRRRHQAPARRHRAHRQPRPTSANSRAPRRRAKRNLPDRERPARS